MSRPDLSGVARTVCSTRGYRLLRKVGSGSYKETYQVRISDGSDRALKVFQQNNTPQRAEREIDAMSRCQHPNIAAFFQLDSHILGGRSYLFTIEEFLPGGTLSERISTSVLSVDQTLSIGSQLIPAVALIASLNLVHRDLKPDNIMFREDGNTPVIVDFGVVRDLSRTGLTGAWVMPGPGTPLYAAPEQLQNDQRLIDWRTDQFALGVLLAECCLGYHPYSEAQDDPGTVVDRVFQRQGPSSRFLSTAQSLKLSALAKMVAPWPAERYRTPTMLAEAWSAQVRDLT